MILGRALNATSVNYLRIYSAIKSILSSTSVTSCRNVSAIDLRTLGLLSLHAFSKTSPPAVTASEATKERRAGRLTTSRIQVSVN